MKDYSDQLPNIIQLHKEGNFKASIPILRKILENDKNNTELLKILSFSELKIGNINESIKIITKAISIKPDIAEYYLIRGFSHMNNEDFKLAIKDFENSIDKDSNLKDAYFNAGVAYSQINDLKKSINYYNKVLELDPNDSRAYTNLAYIKNQMSQFDAALMEVNKSIRINNKDLNLYLLRGTINMELKNFDEAGIDFDKVISDGKSLNQLNFYHEGLYNKSLLKLLLGNYKEGWNLYENRFFTKKHQRFEKFKQKEIFDKIIINEIPYLDKIDNFRDSDILVICEQGIGEHIIFLPLILEAAEIARSITLLIDPRLIPLCERSFKDIVFLPLGSKDMNHGEYKKALSILEKKKFDYQISVASLARFFRKNIEDFKKTPKKFLQVNNKIKNNIKKELDINKNKKKTIGISWKSFKSPFLNKKDINLKKLGLIFKDLDIELVNLQYGDVDDEINDFVKETNIPIRKINYDIKKNLDALTSLIDLCDLVISTDSVTVKLSGAINKETWLLVPNVSTFFYQLNTKDCLWFPSIKLYRQDKRDSWTNILNDMRQDLMKRYN